MGKELRALRGKFCPLCSLSSISSNWFIRRITQMLNSGINFSFTIAMVTKVANKICYNREFSILVSNGAKIRNRYNQVPHVGQI